MSDEEKKEYEELKSLLYTGTISQYGKRKLIDMFEKQQKEIEELKENNKNLEDELNKYIVKMSDEQYRRLVDIIRDEINKLWKDKIKAKIEEVNIKLENYESDKINIFSGQTYMEKFKLLGELYGLQSLLEKE